VSWTNRSKAPQAQYPNHNNQSDEGEQEQTNENVKAVIPSSNKRDLDSLGIIPSPLGIKMSEDEPHVTEDIALDVR
jgi:hypothetical protein